jgi:hypothetical protein
MKGVPRNQNRDNGNEPIRDGYRPKDPAGSQANGIAGSDDLLSARIEKLLAGNRRDWKTATAKANAWRIWQIGLGLAIGLVGAVGYWLYVVHTNPSITSALARSPILISIEALALFFLHQSRVDHEDTTHFTAEADHASRILVRYLVLKDCGDQKALIAFAQTLGKEVERHAGKPKNRDQQTKKRNLPGTDTKELREGIQ